MTRNWSLKVIIIKIIILYFLGAEEWRRVGGGGLWGGGISPRALNWLETALVLQIIVYYVLINYSSLV